jgi:acylpyruvate hydrolase
VPGDVVLTGTPSGVGNARDPKVFLEPGQTVVTRVDRVGELRNVVVA